MFAWSNTMTDAVAFDAELDASGLNCPLPLLKAKMELNKMARGACSR